jgi:tyrosine-protein phosphatase SIW14
VSFWSDAWSWLKAFLGLANNTTDHNIGNLHMVSNGLWRSAQPVTDADWAYLKSLGITRVIKLNFETEGSDAGAEKQNISVFTLSIQPEGDKDLFDNVKNTFVQPNRQALAAAISLIRSGGVLVHCTHGHDRTGLLIGLNRVIFDAWTKKAAYKEMLEMGFHPELHGLHEFWESFSGQL